MKIFLVLLVQFLVVKTFGQTISHIQQFPMHFNPAFVGDKKCGRAGVYGGVHDWKSKNGLSGSSVKAIGSYDRLSQNNKIGYGAEVIYSNGKDYYSYRRGTIGGVKLALSPKIVVHNKSKENELVLAPALGYTYLGSKDNYIREEIKWSDHSFYTLQAPGNINEPKDEDFIANSRHEINTGFLLGNQKFKLALGFSQIYYRVNYDTYIVETGVTSRAYSKLTVQQKDSINANHRISGSQQGNSFSGQRYSLYFSMKLNILRQGTLYFTPIIAMSYNSAECKELFGTYDFVPEINNLGGSLHLKKVYLGATISKNTYHDRNEFYLGYETDKFNIMASLFGLNQKAALALSFNYFLKRTEQSPNTL